MPDDHMKTEQNTHADKNDGPASIDGQKISRRYLLCFGFSLAFAQLAAAILNLEMTRHYSCKKLRERKQRKIPFRVLNVRVRLLQTSKLLLYEFVVRRDFALLPTTRLGYIRYLSLGTLQRKE